MKTRYDFSTWSSNIVVAKTCKDYNKWFNCIIFKLIVGTKFEISNSLKHKRETLKLTKPCKIHYHLYFHLNIHCSLSLKWSYNQTLTLILSTVIDCIIQPSRQFITVHFLSNICCNSYLPHHNHYVLPCVYLKIVTTALWFSRQTRNVDPMLIYCWASIADDGSILNLHWVEKSCLLGWC